VSDSARLRTVLDVVLNWAMLAYGVFAAAVEPVWHHDEMQIAVGAETIVLAVVGFLWAGQRRALGIALIVAGVAAPFVVFGTAPLYWGDVEFAGGEEFWTMMGLGSTVGLPLALLGVLALRRLREATPRRDPWWLQPVRWAIQGGLMLVVIALRGGDWDQGIPIVYAGVALALVSLLVVLPRRLAVTWHGIGVLLAFLGAAALVVIGVAQSFAGGNMSADEALVGLVPATIVLVAGLVLAVTQRRGRRPVESGTTCEGSSGSVLAVVPGPTGERER